MDAITSPPFTSLLKKIRDDNPTITFIAAETSRWSPDEKTIYFIASSPQGEYELLHELAHALLEHHDFTSDTHLLRIEVSAWDYAVKTLGPRYKVFIPEEYIDEALASYRHWLAQKSACPTCGATGMQHIDQSYHCLGCDCSWNTNDARQVAGRRYIA